MRRKGLPLRWHWQNLNTDKNGRIKGGGWKEGRAWFYFGQRGEGMFDAITVNPSWHIGRWGLAADVHLGHGDSQNESGIHLHIGPVALWCFVGRRGFRPHARERQYGFTWHDQILWIHRGQEFWDGSPWAIHVVDRLLGKAKYSTETPASRSTSPSGGARAGRGPAVAVTPASKSSRPAAFPSPATSTATSTTATMRSSP
jgi:hypothetical protein